MDPAASICGASFLRAVVTAAIIDGFVDLFAEDFVEHGLMLACQPTVSTMAAVQR